jgi:hypothetical protein
MVTIKVCGSEMNMLSYLRTLPRRNIVAALLKEEARSLFKDDLLVEYLVASDRELADCNLVIEVTDIDTNRYTDAMQIALLVQSGIENVTSHYRDYPDPSIAEFFAGKCGVRIPGLNFYMEIRAA